MPVKCCSLNGQNAGYCFWDCIHATRVRRFAFVDLKVSAFLYPPQNKFVLRHCPITCSIGVIRGAVVGLCNRKVFLPDVLLIVDIPDFLEKRELRLQIGTTLSISTRIAYGVPDCEGRQAVWLALLEHGYADAPCAWHKQRPCRKRMFAP